MRRILFVIAFVNLLASEVVLSQDFKNSIDLRFRSGFIVPHHGYMKYFITENVTGFQLNYGIQTSGKKLWHWEYNFPVVGVGLHHSGLGNGSLYGSLTGLYFFINREFLNKDSRFNIGNTLSVGLSYASKWHDRVNNRENMVLSTPINVFFQYEVNASYRISRKHLVSMSLGVAHASNGSVKEPNLGFNILTSALSYRYLFGKKLLKPVEKPVDDTPISVLNLAFFGSQKAIDGFTGKQYGVLGLSFEKLYRVAPLSMLGAELSIYSDGSIPDLMVDKNDNSINPKASDKVAISLNANYLLSFGRVSMAFQPGIYLKNGFYGLGGVTNKAGLRVKLNKTIQLSVAIKAHWLAQADFIEVGLRYSIVKHEK